MPRRIGIAFVALMLAGLAAHAEADKPPARPAGSECRKIDRCIPTRDELDGKASQDRLIKTRHDTVKNSISNVR